MNLHVLYRLHAGESGKDRPGWYSKQACFYSLRDQWFWDTFKVYLNHGEVGWLPDDVHVERVDIPDMGDSCVFVAHEALKFPDEDWVYFCEDDYLHKPDALLKLRHCVEDVRPDIVSLYDHPDRYRDRPEHNYTDGKNDIYLSRDHHWRTVPSTCMTYGIRVGVVRENIGLFEKHRHVDWDLFPAILGYTTASYVRYKMVGAIPSLATHCMNGYLAPFWTNQ